MEEKQQKKIHLYRRNKVILFEYWEILKAKIKQVEEAYTKGYFKKSVYDSWKSGATTIDYMINWIKYVDSNNYYTLCLKYRNDWWCQKWEVYMWLTSHEYDCVDLYLIMLGRGCTSEVDVIGATYSYMEEAVEDGLLTESKLEYWTENYLLKYYDGEITKARYYNATTTGYLKQIYNKSSPEP